MMPIPVFSSAQPMQALAIVRRTAPKEKPLRLGYGRGGVGKDRRINSQLPQPKPMRRGLLRLALLATTTSRPFEAGQ